MPTTTPPTTPPKIVITGMGWVTPLGHDLATVWKQLTTAGSGIERTTHFDASTFPTTFSAEVKNYDHAPYVKHPQLHEHVGLNTSFALGAAAQAWKQAGLEAFSTSGQLDHTRLGLYLGAGEGTIDFDPYVATNLAGWDAEAQTVDGRRWAAAARTAFDAHREAEQEPNMPLAHLAMEFDAQGPAYNCLTACAASTQAIGEACEILKRGDADVMITGGCHTMIHPLGVTGFNRLTALSTRNDSPANASRPFSGDRDGFVMGEGAGILILETQQHAKARGATILAQVAGYGSTADAYRITDIHPDGRGAALAMQQALDMANVQTADIDWIAAHGTSTQENDKIETKAIKKIFAPGSDNANTDAKKKNGQTPDSTSPGAQVPPVSSIKSMLGHLIAAAGAVQAIAAVLAIKHDTIPPTANLNTPAPECDLNYVPNTARKTPVNTVLSNSFGFGGQNDTLVIRQA